MGGSSSVGVCLNPLIRQAVETHVGLKLRPRRASRDEFPQDIWSDWYRVLLYAPRLWFGLHGSERIRPQRRIFDSMGHSARPSRNKCSWLWRTVERASACSN